MLGDHRHQLVAIHQNAFLVDDQHAIGITVQRDAEIGTHLVHLLRQAARVCRAAIEIDVEPVRLVVDGHDLGAQLPQRRRCRLVGCPVGTIDDDAHSGERHVLGKGPLCHLDIAIKIAIDALGAADVAVTGTFSRKVFVDQAFDLQFRSCPKACSHRDRTA